MKNSVLLLFAFLSILLNECKTENTSILKYGNFTQLYPRAHWFNSPNITGWKSTKGFDIGLGRLFNSKFNSTQVVTELDVMQNAEIWTIFRFQQDGKYVLSFDYGFRDRLAYQSSLFRVILGSVILWQAKVTDSPFARKSIDLNCKKTVEGESTYLSFFALGTQDTQGGVVGDITLIRQ